MIKLQTVTPLEKWRAQTLFTKEPGTIRWIVDTVKRGDVFFDIGANIGQYTIMAAKRGATVVAFEPHIFNAASLMVNLQKNGLTAADVRVITSALDCEEDGFLDFNYQRMMAGSSGSQLGHTTAETGEIFAPEMVELKHCISVDRLVTSNVLPPPQVVKIDVDGNELRVLEGMVAVLGSIRSLQVESHPKTWRQVTTFLADHGFTEAMRHHTAFGQAEIDKGTDPSKVFCNIIYQRSAA